MKLMVLIVVLTAHAGNGTVHAMFDGDIRELLAWRP
jgi:hypothetical protein